MRTWIQKALDPPINADKRRWFSASIWRRLAFEQEPNGVHRRLSADSKVLPRITLWCLLSFAFPAFAHGPDIAKDVGFEQHPGTQLPRGDAFVDERGRSPTPPQAGLILGPRIVLSRGLQDFDARRVLGFAAP